VFVRRSLAVAFCGWSDFVHWSFVLVSGLIGLIVSSLVVSVSLSCCVMPRGSSIALYSLRYLVSNAACSPCIIDPLSWFVISRR